MLPCFKYSIIDLADERRIGEAAHAPAGVTRSIPHVQSGVRTVPDMEAASPAAPTRCSAGRSTTR